MPQIINTNISSLTAQRNLNNSQSDQATALQRLSSGLRINSAKDDAAGLAISTRFSSQTRGLTVAIRNAGDGISLAQTAEGALGSMTDSLQRIRELALQAANGTNSDSDRQALNAEAQQLISEITRTGEQTNFNGRNLLDGTFDSGFQIGANAGEVIDVSISKLTADELGVSDQAGVSAVATNVQLGNGDLIINGVAIGPSSGQDDPASTNNASASAIAKAEAINRVSDETGVKAVVDENEVAGTLMSADAASTDITINGVTITGVQTTDDAGTTRASVVSAINAVADQTGVTAVDSGSDSNGVTLVAADGRNVEISFSNTSGLAGTNTIQAATGLASAGTYEGGFTLVADGDVSEIVIAGGDGTGNGDLANSGLSAGTYSSGVATVTSTTQTATTGPSISSPFALGGTVVAAAAVAAESITVVAGTDSQTTANVDTAAEVATALNANANITNASAGFSITLSEFSADAAGDGALTVTGASGAIAADNAAEFAAAIAGDANLTAAGFVATDNGDGTVTVTGDGATNFAITGVAGTNNTVSFDLQAADASGTLSSAVKVSGTAGTGDQTVTAYGFVNTGTVTDSSIDSVILSSSGTNVLGASVVTEEVNGIKAALEDGDMVINGTAIGASLASDDAASYTGAFSSEGAASGIAVAEAINRATDSTGVSATVNATQVVGGNDSQVGAAAAGNYTAGDSGSVYINGVDIGVITLADDGNGNLDYEASRLSTIDAINQKSGQTGVTAQDNGVSITLVAADGRNISVAIDNNGDANDGTDNGTNARGAGFGAAIGLSAAVDGVGEADLTDANTNAKPAATAAVTNLAYQTTYSTVTLNSASEINLEGGTAGSEGLTGSGFSLGEYGGAADGQFLKDVDISTLKGATEALTAIDNALDKVNAARADLGAVQNRFETTISNLAVAQENLTAANSRIKDADFAAETAELSRTRVLQQAGISILAQANALPQQALSLLQ